MNRFLPFLRWQTQWRDPETIRADLFAGLTGAVVVLPQAVAYATLAISLEWAILLGLLTAFLVSRTRAPRGNEAA